MKQLVLLGLSVVMMSSCKKELPYATVTVDNKVFGCYVNGRPFIADDWDYGNNIPPIHVNFWYSPVTRSTTHLIAKGNKENESVTILLNPPFQRGRRELKFRTNTYPCIPHPEDYGSYWRSSQNQEFITNDSIGGYVDITYVDTINQKIEACFEFTAINLGTGETIRVTKGFFKIK